MKKVCLVLTLLFAQIALSNPPADKKVERDTLEICYGPYSDIAMVVNDAADPTGLVVIQDQFRPEYQNLRLSTLIDELPLADKVECSAQEQNPEFADCSKFYSGQKEILIYGTGILTGGEFRNQPRQLVSKNLDGSTEEETLICRWGFETIHYYK